MSASVTCACGRTIKVRPEHAGRKIRCPGCSEPVQVPAEPTPAVAAPAAPAEPAPARPAPAAAPPDEPAPADLPEESGEEEAPARGLLGGMKAKVKATVRAGKEEAKRQARRAEIALDVSRLKKELEEVYAQLGEKVVQDPALGDLVGLEDVRAQIARLDAEIGVAEEEAEQLRRELT